MDSLAPSARETANIREPVWKREAHKVHAPGFSLEDRISVLPPIAITIAYSTNDSEGLKTML